MFVQTGRNDESRQIVLFGLPVRRDGGGQSMVQRGGDWREERRGCLSSKHLGSVRGCSPAKSPGEWLQEMLWHARAYSEPPCRPAPAAKRPAPASPSANTAA